jgi:ribosomal 50S subunit-associated protein YjgA (DUF615 family)
LSKDLLPYFFKRKLNRYKQMDHRTDDIQPFESNEKREQDELSDLEASLTTLKPDYYALLNLNKSVIPHNFVYTQYLSSLQLFLGFGQWDQGGVQEIE